MLGGKEAVIFWIIMWFVLLDVITLVAYWIL
jgi:hypothetical protein